jgi:hypothetical protein
MRERFLLKKKKDGSRLMKIAGLEKLHVQYSKNTPAASLSYACKFTDAPLSLARDGPSLTSFLAIRLQLLVSITMAATRG